MTRSRVHSATKAARTLAVGLAATLGALLVVSACDSSSKAVGPGGECALATDCAPGLVCVEQANHTRVCTDDLSRVAGKPPTEGGAGDAEAEGGEGGTTLPDGNVPDVPIVPPPDTGPPDTFVPPADTGPPPDDAGGD